MSTKIVLIVSGIIFVVLAAMAIVFSNNFVLSTNLLLLAIIILIVPFYIYRFFEFKRIKDYESEFPNFLRDLAESQRAGLSILQAMQNSSKSDYGSFTKEIKKISNQISWNIPFDTAMKNFEKRMHSSKIISRSVAIIQQANNSGGNVESTMESLANNIEMIKEVQQEKATLMSQQVVLMYAIFFIFLGITIALIKFLIPLLQAQAQTQTTAYGSFGQFEINPCKPCSEIGGLECTGCTVFLTVGNMFAFGDKADATTYYRSLFFTMIIIQGFFTGLVAGQISSDSAIAGVKHSLIMLMAGFIVFMSAVRLGLI
ncbi:MAG: type II secretion system F family protein [Candidatus Aenigmatarchaeota archaeon]